MNLIRVFTLASCFSVVCLSSQAFSQGFDNGPGGFDNGPGGFDIDPGGFDIDPGGFDRGPGGLDDIYIPPRWDRVPDPYPETDLIWPPLLKPKQPDWYDFPIPGLSASCCSSCMCGGEPTPAVQRSPSIGSPKVGSKSLAVSKSNDSPSSPGSSNSTDISLINSSKPMTYLTTVGLQNSEHVIYCSGVLVSARSVLTAAHCVCGDETISYAFVGHNLERQHANELVTSLPLEKKPEFLNDKFCDERDQWKAGQIKVYPKWDLAILHLSEKLPSDIHHWVHPFEPIADNEEYSHLYGVGFGRADGVNIPGIKHRSRFKFESRHCTESESKEHGCNPETESITVGYDHDAGADSCFADSGGPIFARNSADNSSEKGYSDVPRLIAITSRGLGENQPGYCGKGAINTSVEYQEARHWINNTRKLD